MTLKRKPLTAEMRTSCYLLRPVRISAISSPMLSCSREQNCCLWSTTTSWKCVKNYLLTILHPLVCEPENRAGWKTMKDFLPQNQFLYFWPLPVKYRIRLRHHCFQWIINLFDFTSTVWTKLPHGNDKARFLITAVLTWSLKSVMFSLTTTVST